MKLRYGGGYATPVRPVLKVSPVVVNVVYSPVSDTSVCYNAMSTETNSPVSVSKMTANATDKSVISLMARLYEDQGLPPQESSVGSVVCPTPFRPAAPRLVIPKEMPTSSIAPDKYMTADDKSAIMARLYEDQGLPPQESSVVNMVCPFRPAAMSKLKKQSAKMV